MDPATRLLSPVTEGGDPIGNFGEGFCLYDSPAGDVYAFTITIAGLVRQFELTDTDIDGLLEAAPVRSFQVGSEAEGCQVDDVTGALYVSEEDHTLWRYSAAPAGGSTRTAVDGLVADGGHLANDIEGITLVDQGAGAGYLIVSAQNVADPNASYFNLYRRGAGNAFVAAFRITNGTGSDDCDRTDGIAASAASLGTSFPEGIFVCQDNNNDAPGSTGNQNLKLVRLEKILALDGAPPPPPPPSSIGLVGQATSNTQGTAFSARVPTGVEAGDALLLFASQGNVATLTGPGAGWTQAGKVTDGLHTTTAWRRVATASDAGSTVRLTSDVTVKAALTLAAYEGTDATNPIASITGVPEPGTTAGHTTPTVPNTLDGALRVSYWSDRNSATTSWAAPAGEKVRATTLGSGGGRVDTLLTDPGTAQTAGSPASTGGLTATADATAGTATSWTILLRPGTAPPPPENLPPTARFTFDCTGQTCSFDGSTSSDEDSVTGWTWDFGDGTTGTGSTTEHTYTASGLHDVALTVT